jgi:hypothetical protein
MQRTKGLVETQTKLLIGLQIIGDNQGYTLGYTPVAIPLPFPTMSTRRDCQGNAKEQCKK